MPSAWGIRCSLLISMQSEPGVWVISRWKSTDKVIRQFCDERAERFLLAFVYGQLLGLPCHFSPTPRVLPAIAGVMLGGPDVEHRRCACNLCKSEISFLMVSV